MLQKSTIYPEVNFGGVLFYNVTDAPSDKKMRFLESTPKAQFKLKRGKQYASVASWRRFERFDGLVARAARRLFARLRSGPSGSWAKWYRESNVLAVYSWVTVFLLVAVVWHMILHKKTEVSLDYASKIFEIFGTVVSFIGTVWIGAGVALTKNQRATLERLRKKKISINSKNFDLADTLLTASARGIEGIKIMSQGLLFLGLHFWLEQLQAA